MDVVANIILVVESEKRVISGQSCFIAIVENYLSFQWKSWNHRSHCSSVSNSDRYHWLLILTAVLVLAFFCDWKLQQAESSTWEIIFIINLYEITRVTQWWPPQATTATVVGQRRQGQYRESTTRRLELCAGEQWLCARGDCTTYTYNTS